VGIMLLGFSTLLSVKLALWPILPAASVSDTHTNRFILMGVSYGILLGSTIWISRRLASPVMWGLIGMNVYGTILAFVIRTGFFYRVFWPNWMAITGIYVAFFFAIVLLYRFVIRPVPSIVSPGR